MGDLHHSYLDKMNFLSRVDENAFEREREARLKRINSAPSGT
jgi:hypothetical protein